MFTATMGLALAMGYGALALAGAIYLVMTEDKTIKRLAYEGLL